MPVYTLNVNMTRGEASPLLQARVDTEFFEASVAKALNTVIMRYGGVTRAPGSHLLGFAKDGNDITAWLRFEFSRTQVYAIEAGDGYFRFWTRQGRVMLSGSPYEVVTPYNGADLRYVRYRQIGDEIYLFCRGYQPRVLRRLGETNWTLTSYVTEDGPYLDINTTGTKMAPGGTNLLAAETITSGGVDGTREIVATGVSNQYVVKSWAKKPERAPTEWTLEGYDGTTWSILDNQTGQSGWRGGETRFFSFPNETSYEKYRIIWLGVDDPEDGAVWFEIRLNRAAADQTPFNMTASSTTGINDGAGFLPSDVGRALRFLGSDGRWRWCRIMSHVSNVRVTVIMYGPPLPNGRATALWRLGAWSESSGWPSEVELYEDRIVAARTDSQPLGMWASVTGDYDNYRTSDPLVADDGVSLKLTGGRLNEISWLAEATDIMAGTAQTLRAVGRNSENQPFGPSNVRQRAETRASASDVQPLVIENVILFLDYFSTRLYEAAFTYEADGYLAREVSTVNEHLFMAGVTKLAYIDAPHKMVVGLRPDGKLIAFTYDREQKVAGGALLDFGGEVEDILDLPGDAGTDLWMVVHRTINGVSRRTIEVMGEFWRQDFALGPPVYSACSLVYQGAPTNVVTGADLLNNETVGVWADGIDLGDVTVTGNTLTLPLGVEASEVVFGYRMPFAVHTLRTPQHGNQDGSGLGRKVRIVSGRIDMYETAGLKVGPVAGPVEPMIFEDDAERLPLTAEPLRSGMFSVAVDDSWSGNGVLAIEGDSMYPATIRAISLEVEGEP